MPARRFCLAVPAPRLLAKTSVTFIVCGSIFGTDRSIARKQQIMWRGVPGAGCDPQEGANCVRCWLTKIEFVVNVIDVHDHDRLAFSAAQLGERTNLVYELGSSKHYRLGTGL